MARKKTGGPAPPRETLTVTIQTTLPRELGLTDAQRALLSRMLEVTAQTLVCYFNDNRDEIVVDSTSDEV